MVEIYRQHLYHLAPRRETSLQEFLTSLNEYHSSIKFTATLSSEETIFLNIYKDLPQGTSYTDRFTCETNHQYLHNNSCHTKHCKTAIPYGQALRLRRICSEENLQKRAEELTGYLLNRGHPEEHLRAEIQRVPRDVSLTHPEQEKTERIPLVITYIPTIPPIGHITRRHHNILHASKRLKQAIPSPLINAFRRPKNLRDLLG